MLFYFLCPFCFLIPTHSFFIPPLLTFPHKGVRRPKLLHLGPWHQLRSLQPWRRSSPRPMPRLQHRHSLSRARLGLRGLRRHCETHPFRSFIYFLFFFALALSLFTTVLFCACCVIPTGPPHAGVTQLALPIAARQRTEIIKLVALRPNDTTRAPGMTNPPYPTIVFCHKPRRHRHSFYHLAKLLLRQTVLPHHRTN